LEARLGRGAGAEEECARMRARHCAPATDAPGTSHRRAGSVAAGAAAPARRSVQVVATSPGPNEVPANAKGRRRVVDVDVNMGGYIAPFQEDPAEEDGDIECGCCFAEYTFMCLLVL
jgi:hypothetical protein